MQNKARVNIGTAEPLDVEIKDRRERYICDDRYGREKLGYGYIRISIIINALEISNDLILVNDRG